jgi:DNA-binding transcriptional MerR regulator
MGTDENTTDFLDIADVSARSGLAASALRFYEREGLIQSAARSGLRRQYAPDVLRRLAAISLARLSAFSIAEIRLLFATDGRPEEWKPLAASKLEEIGSQIERLEFLRINLQHALACTSPNIWSCRYFQHALATVREDGGPRRTPAE